MREQHQVIAISNSSTNHKEDFINSKNHSSTRTDAAEDSTSKP
jgi:hypothetical protein